MNDDQASQTIQATYGTIINYIRTKVPEPDCFDIAQESVVIFCSKDHAGISNPKAFLWGIVHNKIKQFYQSKSTLVTMTGIMDMIPVSVMATRLSSKIAHRNDLECAMQKLPRRLHEAFELRFVEELSLEECVEVTGRSLATFKRDLEAAKQFLAKQLHAPLTSDDEARALARSTR